MVELQNNRQQLWVNSDFAAAFRGATKEAAASREAPVTAATVSPLQKAVESASALASATSALPAVSTPAPATTATTAAATTTAPFDPSDPAANPPGWDGSPNAVGSSNNPIAAWNQPPGQQPAWITGNYPGATWTAVKQAGFLMPNSDLQPGPGEDAFSSANANVVNQDWTKYYGEVDGTQAGNQMVWGANNPTDAIPAPWMASTNPDPQYTSFDPSNSSQPTQPNYVAPTV